MSEYMDYIADVNDVQDIVNDLALKMYKQGKADAIKTIDEELKEVRHCLKLAKEQMLIDYVYIACEHLDNIVKLKEQK